jgi:hypothetical protein
MKLQLLLISLLFLSLLPVSSVAQTEPKPEVDVFCENYYNQELNPNPRYSSYYNEVSVECTLQNDNAYSVEVETAIQWIYSNNYDSSSSITINANSEEYFQFQIYGSDDAPAGFETLTFEATVIQYGGVRECTDCETTTHSLEIEVLEWTAVELELLSESPTGTFGISEMYEIQLCAINDEYQLGARISVDGNHDVNPAIGFDYEYSDPYPKAGTMKVEVPKRMELDINAGDTTDVDASFSLEVLENHTEDVYVIFIVVLGESDEVSQYLNNGYYSSNVDLYFGGCLVEGIEYQFNDNKNNPIIIETSSDNSKIYLVAGIGGATTICLLIALIALLARKRH